MICRGSTAFFVIKGCLGEHLYSVLGEALESIESCLDSFLAFSERCAGLY